MAPSLVTIARVLVTSVGGYLAAGLIVAPWLVWRGVGRIDPHASDATLGFRLVIVPGVLAFWPMLLWRLGRGASTPPMERNAHRAAARRGLEATR